MRKGDRQLFDGHNPVSAGNLKRLVELIKSGHGDSEIARIFGCDHSSIFHQRRKLGFKPFRWAVAVARYRSEVAKLKKQQEEMIKRRRVTFLEKNKSLLFKGEKPLSYVDFCRVAAQKAPPQYKKYYMMQRSPCKYDIVI